MALIWETFDGRQKNFLSLSHQHLSNIIWYFEIILEEEVHPLLQEMLDARFGGLRLFYRPMITFKNEIDILFEKGYIKNKHASDIIVNGKWIGEIAYD